MSFLVPPGASTAFHRVYLAMLPILSICDMLAGALAFLAIVNPLRCGAFLRLMSAKWNNHLETSCHLSPEFQKVVLWNARLRSIAIRSGLASLLDLLLLPLGLVVCITLYRAGPLVAAMCDTDSMEPGVETGLTAQDCGSLAKDFGEYDGEDLHEAELPISPVHQMALKQFTLLLCDLLTLPSFIVVFLTRYRYPFMKAQTEELQKSWGPVAHHVAAFINSLVLLHDVLLALCMLPLLLTIYRWPKAYQLLRNRWVAVVPLPRADPVADSSDPEVEDCSRILRAFASAARCPKELGNLLLDLPLLPLLLILILSLWRRKAVILQFLELLRDGLGFLALLVVCITLLRMPKVLLDIYSQRARRATGDPCFTLQRVSLRSGDGNGDQRLTVQAEGLQLEARDLKDSPGDVRGMRERPGPKVVARLRLCMGFAWPLPLIRHLAFGAVQALAAAALCTSSISAELFGICSHCILDEGLGTCLRCDLAETFGTCSLCIPGELFGDCDTRIPVEPYVTCSLCMSEEFIGNCSTSILEELYGTCLWTECYNDGPP
eukprot:s103_g31.t1